MQWSIRDCRPDADVASGVYDHAVCAGYRGTVCRSIEVDACSRIKARCSTTDVYVVAGSVIIAPDESKVFFRVSVMRHLQSSKFTGGIGSVVSYSYAICNTSIVHNIQLRSRPRRPDADIAVALNPHSFRRCCISSYISCSKVECAFCLSSCTSSDKTE